MERQADEEIAKELVVAFLSHATFNTGVNESGAGKWGKALGELYATALKEIRAAKE